MIRAEYADPQVVRDDEDLSEWDGWAGQVPHACEPDETDPSGSRHRDDADRLVGIDAARGLALLGMFAVHIFSASTADGRVSLPWIISSGTSSALFAVLAGVGLAFMSGRDKAVPASRHGVIGARLAVRAALILAVGLLLGQVVPVTTAGIILPYFGLLFVMAIPFLRMSPRALLMLGLGWAVVAPVLSHLLRVGRVEDGAVNLRLEHVLTRPWDSLGYLFGLGLYPALTWFAYILVGLALGRMNLFARSVVLNVTVLGALLAAGAALLSRLVMGPFGGVDQLAADLEGTITLEELTGNLVWGRDGTAPATSWWWFGSAAPHTGLPLDLLRTIGLAFLILGLCLAVAMLWPRLLRPLAGPGSMTLTLYSLHLLLLISPLSDLPPLWHYLAQVALLFFFAALWRTRFRRGPLEGLVSRIAGLVGRRRTTDGPRPETVPATRPGVVPARSRADTSGARRGRHRHPTAP